MKGYMKSTDGGGGGGTNARSMPAVKGRGGGYGHKGTQGSGHVEPKARGTQGAGMSVKPYAKGVQGRGG